MFDKGQTLYTLDGTYVEFDHEHEGTAYVYPIQTVVIQCTTYHGDDFDELEDERVADHLIAVPMDKLTTDRPIPALDAEIIKKKEELDAIKAATARAAKEKEQAQRRIDMELADSQRRMDQWKEKHRVFDVLGRMLDGEDLFPLEEVKNPYHKSWAVPYIPEWKDVKVVTLKHGNMHNSSPWTVNRSYGDSTYMVRFFDTEEERTARVSELFDTACEDFRKKPDYGTEGKTYTTRLDYGTLQRWREKHPHLSLPQDIVDAKVASDAAAKEAQKARLQQQLEALEG
ncbi:hypothetical protein MAL1_00205 [Bacteriophage DSS3_MAL1]|nr:hypothetical protein MAL1_00205 [Bacteriophage DSS3_MAL1]